MSSATNRAYTLRTDRLENEECCKGVCRSGALVLHDSKMLKNSCRLGFNRAGILGRLSVIQSAAEKRFRSAVIMPGALHGFLELRYFFADEGSFMFARYVGNFTLSSSIKMIPVIVPVKSDAKSRTGR